MNVDRFTAFREQSVMILRNSKWLTEQMDNIIIEMENLPEDCDISCEEDLVNRMDELQRKADWEGREYGRFTEEYKDMFE